MPKTGGKYVFQKQGENMFSGSKNGLNKTKYTSYRKCEAADVTRDMRVKYIPIHGYNDTELRN
jgi:hypothetical protein